MGKAFLDFDQPCMLTLGPRNGLHLLKLGNVPWKFKIGIEHSRRGEMVNRTSCVKCTFALFTHRWNVGAASVEATPTSPIQYLCYYLFTMYICSSYSQKFGKIVWKQRIIPVFCIRKASQRKKRRERNYKSSGSGTIIRVLCIHPYLYSMYNVCLVNILLCFHKPYDCIM